MLGWIDSPSVLDVLVDDAGDPHSEQGVVPAAHEHDGDAHDHADDGEEPGNNDEEEIKSSFSSENERI